MSVLSSFTSGTLSYLMYLMTLIWSLARRLRLDVEKTFTKYKNISSHGMELGQHGG